MNGSSSIGSILRQARRRRRVGLKRAAAEMRVRPEYLSSLESDDLDFLPPVYVRAFLKEYCSYLRMDAAPLLEMLDRGARDAPLQDEQIQKLEQAWGRAPRRSPLGGWGLPGLLATVILAATAIVALDAGGRHEQSPPAGAGRPPPAVEGEGTSAPLETPASAVSDEQPDPARDGLVVQVLATRGDCWLQVHADGQLLFTSPGRGLAAGESAGAFKAKRRMKLRLGNAAAVDLVVNGTRVGGLGAEGQVVEIRLPDDMADLV